MKIETETFYMQVIVSYFEENFGRVNIVVIDINITCPVTIYKWSLFFFKLSHANSHDSSKACHNQICI